MPGPGFTGTFEGPTAPPGLPWPGRERGGGAHGSPLGRKSPLPLVPVALGLARVRGCGTGTSDARTAEPEPHQSKPLGGAVLVQAPPPSAPRVRQGRGALEGGGPVLRGARAHSRPKAIPPGWCRGLRAHLEGRRDFCKVPPGLRGSTEAERGRSWKARRGSSDSGPLWHFANGATAPSPVPSGRSSRSSPRLRREEGHQPVGVCLQASRPEHPELPLGSSQVGRLTPRQLSGLWLPSPSAALSPMPRCHLSLPTAPSCRWLGPHVTSSSVGSEPPRLPLSSLKPPGRLAGGSPQLPPTPAGVPWPLGVQGQTGF